MFLQSNHSALASWMKVIPDSYPVFFNVETTGVGNSDVLTALSALPASADSVIFQTFSVADDKLPKALEFLRLSEEQYRARVAIDGKGAQEFLRGMSSIAGKPLLLLSYNAEFQQKFLAQRGILDGLAEEGAVQPIIDFTRLCMCAEQAARVPASFEQLLEDVPALTVRKTGYSFKAVLASFGVPIPDPLLPWHKPALLRDLMLRAAGISTGPLDASMTIPEIPPARWMDWWARLLQTHGISQQRM